MKIRSLLCAFCVSMATSGPLLSKAIPTRMAVMPFSAEQGEAQGWLSKGLADLVSVQLSELQDIEILDREHVKEFLEEIDLAHAPLFDQTHAQTLGRVAKVDEVLYGTYRLQGQRIEIVLFTLDLKTQQLLRTEKENGTLRDLRALVSVLVKRYASDRGRPLTSAELKRLDFRPTDSVSATERFYRGLDHFDQGRLPDALSEFLLAQQQDPHYLDAELWSGRMYEFLGKRDHAIARYEALFKRNSTRVEALDAQLFSAALQESGGHRSQAIQSYDRLIQAAPETPHGVLAAYRISALVGPARAFGFLNDLVDWRARMEKEGLESLPRKTQASRFTQWRDVLPLYADALVRQIAMYPSMVEIASYVPKPPRGTFLLRVDHPEIGERFGETSSILHGGKISSTWREELYAIVAPPGYEMTGATMELVGRLENQHPDTDFTMRLYPFPLPKDPQQGWIGVLYGQTRTLSTVRKTISFHGQNRRVMALQLIESHGKIERWRLRVKLKKTAQPTPLVEDPAPGETPGQEPFYEGQLMGILPLPAEASSLSTRDLTTAFYKPQRDLAIGQDRSGRWSVIAAIGDPETQNTDLWESQSGNGKEWTALSRMPINSQSADWSPRLVRGEDGSQWLAWISQRRGKGWELWWSHRKPNASWSSPRRVPLESWGFTPWQDPTEQPAWFLEYDIAQDRRGRWLVAFQANLSEVVILQSRDLDHWEMFGRLPSVGRLHGFALRQDLTERYLLAGFSASGDLRTATSTNGRQWDVSSGGSGSRSPLAHRLELLPVQDGVWRLTSDKHGGPRVSLWHPNEIRPESRIVARTRLQNISAALNQDRETWMVLREKDHLFVRRYREFFTTVGHQKSGDVNALVTREYERDAEGNLWTRAFPGARFIVPDVTAVGAVPAHPGEEKRAAAVWFGIETGAFFHRGDTFEKTNVTQGFFDHFVTEIQSCPDLPVLFASVDRSDPVLGTGEALGMTHRFSTMAIPGAQGAITGIICGKNRGEAFLDTSANETWQLRREEGGLRWNRANSTLGPRAQRKALMRRVKNPIYPEIGRIVQDAKGGIWYFSAEDAPSKGLAYFDGQTNKLYNPPHGMFTQPSGLAVDHHGDVWVGTWFNGLYKLQLRKGGR